MARSRGFTLLEVMLVVMLLGGIAMTVMASLPTRSDLQQADERLTQALQWASAQATLEGRIYGMAVTQYGWQLMVISNTVDNSLRESLYWPKRYWHSVKNSNYRQSEILPVNLVLHLDIANETQVLSQLLEEDPFFEPQLLFLPGGESNTFHLTLQDVDGEKQATIHSPNELQLTTPVIEKFF
ncbi:type II secretion system protein H [Serratia quinivorans]|uniref:type II secretion system minor pseudopilin GspH n=1 Tax=Serratia quinivorans TaxID=137545 RepID=UPI002178EA62|nr:type II secretion system minor pseudopilin GspH [Serratia quinivorans]CAI1926604.1 type II secretion system protein H [Serratia quinivorans]